MENGGSDRPKNCVYIRIHSIVMGGRLKPPKRDVKDPDTIRGAGSNHGLTHPGRWREVAARPSDGEPGATGAHRLSWPKAVSSGQVYRGRVRVQIYLVGGGRCGIACWDCPRGSGITWWSAPRWSRCWVSDSPRWAETFRSFFTPKPSRSTPWRAPSASRAGLHRLRLPCRPEVTLEQDLLRRDLTINAIAEDEDGQLHDPYGGVQDLEARLLRHVSPAFAEILCASCGWRASPPVSMPRVRGGPRDAGADARDDGGWRAGPSDPGAGLEGAGKVLLGPTPQIFFEVLRECGALKALFPELDALFGVPAPARWHPEIDTGIHTMMVLAQACRLSPELDRALRVPLPRLWQGLTRPPSGRAITAMVRRGCRSFGILRALPGAERVSRSGPAGERPAHPYPHCLRAQARDPAQGIRQGRCLAQTGALCPAARCLSRRLPRSYRLRREGLQSAGLCRRGPGGGAGCAGQGDSGGRLQREAIREQLAKRRLDAISRVRDEWTFIEE